MKSFLRYHIKDRLVLSHKRSQLVSSKELPILVFTMAKVGSLSVYRSIINSSKNPCFHIHSLNEEEIKQANQVCFDAKLFPDSRSPAKLINDEIIRKEKSYLVISLFRNPIERMFSAFFEVFRLVNGVEPDEYKEDTSKLIQTFNKWVDFSYMLNWYGKQFLEGTGVDVYDYAFDKSKNYSIIEKGKSKVLLMNSNIEDHLKTEIIREFTGIKEFRLSNTNITSESSASELYKDFKKNIQVEKSVLVSVMESKYSKHFFADEERNQIIDKWGL